MKLFYIINRKDCTLIKINKKRNLGKYSVVFLKHFLTTELFAGLKAQGCFKKCNNRF